MPYGKNQDLGLIRREFALPQISAGSKMAAVGVISKNMVRLVATLEARTQREIAKLAGIREADLSHTINHASDDRATLWTAVRFARAVGCSLDDIVRGLDPMYDNQRNSKGVPTVRAQDHSDEDECLRIWQRLPLELRPHFKALMDQLGRATKAPARHREKKERG